MFLMCGYDFCRDNNALNPAPIIVNNYTDVKLSNGLFDHWNVTEDVTSPYSPEIPTAWDYLTIMNANFNGNIEAGNASNLVDGSIEGFKIKRRKIEEFNWITLKYITKEELISSGFSFAFNDNLAQSGVTYEYAFVPIVGGVEGDYIINSIETKFDGVFICDLDTIYKFYAGVKYGTQERVQKIGVFEPYGRQYPVVVSNSVINYNRGSFSGTILANDYLRTKALDRMDMVKEREQLMDFLTNKKAKILKDWNGNNWLMLITSNGQTSFSSNYGMGIATASASWTEIGDANKQSDLYNSGIIKEAE